MGPIGKSVRSAFVALLLTAGPAASAPTVAPLDREVRIDGLDVACTGFGRAAREDPRWQSYGTRIEFSNARSEYLAGAVVTVRDRTGRAVLDAACDAPWLLVRLRPGAYRVEGRLTGVDAKPRSASFTAPAKGQLRVVLQFVEAP